MTNEEEAAFRAKVLREGVTLHAASNVAPGSPGRVVRRMAWEGLLTCERVSTGPLPDEVLWNYQPKPR